MNIVFTIEASGDAREKIRELGELQDELNRVIGSNSYGPSLDHLYINIFCLNERMEALFPPRGPIYLHKPRNYMYRGERLQKPAKSLEYELRLDYAVYSYLPNYKERLRIELLQSLEVMKGFPILKEIDIDRLRNDMNGFFVAAGW